MIFCKVFSQNPWNYSSSSYNDGYSSDFEGTSWKKKRKSYFSNENIKKSSRQSFGNYIKSISEKTACRYRKRRGLTIRLKRVQFSSVMLLGGDKYHTFWLKYWSESLDLLQNHENIGYFDWTQLCNHLPDANVLTQVFNQFREINTVG